MKVDLMEIFFYFGYRRVMPHYTVVSIHFFQDTYTDDYVIVGIVQLWVCPGPKWPLKIAEQPILAGLLSKYSNSRYILSHLLFYKKTADYNDPLKQIHRNRNEMY